MNKWQQVVCDNAVADVDKTRSEGECFPPSASPNRQCLADNDEQGENNAVADLIAQLDYLCHCSLGLCIDFYSLVNIVQKCANASIYIMTELC